MLCHNSNDDVTGRRGGGLVGGGYFHHHNYNAVVNVSNFSKLRLCLSSLAWKLNHHSWPLRLWPWIFVVDFVLKFWTYQRHSNSVQFTLSINVHLHNIDNGCGIICSCFWSGLSVSANTFVLTNNNEQLEIN